MKQRHVRRAGAMAALALVAGPALADGLVDNVNGYTIARDGTVERFTGLVIDNEGKVAHLLQGKDKRPEKLDYKLDGQGRTLIPGLIDSHGHVMALGFRALHLDLSDARTLEEAQEKLRQWARDNPSQRWIVGGGWNQERWGLGRFPTAADIDAVVADRPVWLVRVDGHAGVANSAAMAKAGIGPKTIASAGGRIELAGGKPTGMFIDAAMGLVDKAIPAPQPLERDLALAKAQEILIQNGITAVADMGTTVDDWAVMRRSGDMGRLRVRILSYAYGIEPLVSIAGTGPTPWLYGGRLRMIGVKLVEDGALGSRGAWLKADYADAAGQRGLNLLDDAKLKNLGSRAAMDGFQVAIHAIGDAANAQTLDAIEELAGTYKGDRRWRIEHAQIVDPVDLPRFGRNGIVASMQPVHQTSDRAMTEARLGPSRLVGAYAWSSMLKAGAKLAFGSDFPVENPDPFAGLAAAISREDAAGQPQGGWMPEQKLTMPQALSAFTRDAAFAGFADDRIGTLETGRYADFILLDRDIFASSPAEVRGTKVMETWIGGKRMWVRK